MHFLAVRGFPQHQSVSSAPLQRIPPPRESRKDSKSNEASLALLIISFCGYYFPLYVSDPSGRTVVSNKFCPSAVFEYLFFRDGKVRFEGILGSGDRCFKEPKPSRDLLELTGLSVPQQLATTAGQTPVTPIWLSKAREKVPASV